ncbi:hypothetical protein PybrP1_012717 [[Pythium] brassicae (nom. inval.)]|nr:hypothetical protein PybrP1_012717 [[Pythium] brassicae (nom. inval.)]
MQDDDHFNDGRGWVGGRDAEEPYTVSKMLSSFNAVMKPVAQDPSASVSLKRKAANGVMLDTSASEIALLDTQAKVKHSAQRVAKLSRADKAAWADAQRLRGNVAFQRRLFAEAADCYVQALAALDFGSTAVERQQCQLSAQLPLTCNLAACMLMTEQWEKARQMCDEALKVHATYIKALQQRGRACTKLNDFEAARDGDSLARLEKQLVDIDRAETRHKQQLAQHQQFQKKMMREAVGRLYTDKKEVAPLRADALAAAPQSQLLSEATWVTRVLAHSRLLLTRALRLGAQRLVGFVRRFLRQPSPPCVKDA